MSSESLNYVEVSEEQSELRYLLANLYLQLVEIDSILALNNQGFE